MPVPRASEERGRSQGDDRRPWDPHGQPTGGRYQREFGVPAPTSQGNFTDPHSRIMKRSGGGFDASYNAQTAVDDTAHLIVAAEVGNNANDAGQPVPMLQAVQTNTGHAPSQVLADAGYRSEKNFEDLADSPTDIVVAMGREDLSVQRHFEVIADTHCQSLERANTQTPVLRRNSIKDANFESFCRPHS